MASYAERIGLIESIARNRGVPLDLPFRRCAVAGLRASLVVGTAAALILTEPLPAQSQVAPGFPLEIAATKFYFDADKLGILVDGAIAPDGRFCVADFGEADIACLSPGSAKWTHIGRKGEGPGEFTSPYRLAFTPQGRMWVWDFQTQQVSLFDRAGHFTGRSPLLHRFRQVDNILALCLPVACD